MPPIPLLVATPPRSVAVFRPQSLAGLLCAVPALRALRAAAPTARVVLVGLPDAAEFAARFEHLINGFVPFPGWPDWPGPTPPADAVAAFLMAVRAAEFDLAVQLHGPDAAANECVSAFAASRVAGFYRPGDPCPDPALYVPWVDNVPEVRRLLDLAAFLGAPPRGDHLEFPVWDVDSVAAAEAAGRDLGDFVCVQPGGRWPPERFADVADALAERGLTVVLTGAAESAPVAHRVDLYMRAPAVDVTGKTPLGATAALLAGARLVVSDDAAATELAAAVRTPSVAVVPVARCGSVASGVDSLGSGPGGEVPVADVLARAVAVLDRPSRGWSPGISS